MNLYEAQFIHEINWSHRQSYFFLGQNVVTICCCCTFIYISERERERGYILVL